MPVTPSCPNVSRSVSPRWLAVLAVASALVPLMQAAPAQAETRTIIEALAAAYANNPSLQSARAALRSVDENVPAALAGWRPTVTVSATGGTGGGDTSTVGTDFFGRRTRSDNAHQSRTIDTQTVQLTQPLYRGGRTVATTNRAESQVAGQRARLIAAEQTVFTNVVNAYVSVIQTQEILALNINNEQVLSRQLQATNDRFRVGEITRTDVAQAEAALAGATATRQTAEGNLQTARSQFLQYVGELPGELTEPQPLKLTTRTLDEAKSLASANNPNVIAARYDDAAAKDAFDIAYSALMPNVSVTAQVFRNEGTLANTTTRGSQVIASLSVPIYQGGSEYAAVRQARQLEQQALKTVDDQRRAAVQQVIAAWETYTAAKATVQSTHAQIRSNQIALEGVQREAIVGSRTTLDVLNAEQLLLNSRVTLVQNLANLVTASYQVAAATGRLTARDLRLPVPLYDETAYYNAVRNRWIGTGDLATDQPGR
jgi:outer membrane protein